MDQSLQDLKTDETSPEGLYTVEKLKQSYLLLKQKMCGTHDVIKKYNDKLKECERLKVDFDAANKGIKTVTFNYNTTLAKVIKLELQNTEYKKSIEALTTQVNEHKVKAAADQQHIQQLICKVKDVEGQQNERIMKYDLEKSSLQVKVKELEQELKAAKKSCETKTKKIEKKAAVEVINKPLMKDVGMNTTFIQEVITQKVEVVEKYVMTDAIYNVKDDIYPIFCAKCEVLLEPPPVEKICEMMADSCPRFIEQIASPRKKVSVSVQVSNDIITEKCKSETVRSMSETPPPRHLPNQNNQPYFTSTSLLQSHIPTVMNPAIYCANFPQQPNLMHQGAYYIGPPPANSLPLTNSNPVNQNNNGQDISTIASSLSIMSSMQKRIDTLETELKNSLKANKSVKNNNRCKRISPNTDCTQNANTSMQMNFIDLCKRMMDLYESKEKTQFDIYKIHQHKESKKNKLSRLKPKKRLQSVCNNSWKVETVAKKIQQKSFRKKPRNRKQRCSVLQNKFDTPQKNIEALEKSISDTDTNSYCDLFDDTIANNKDVDAETNVSCSKMSTCSSQFLEEGEVETVETIQTLTESNKSAGGETDSGILSDSVESSKVLPIETDVNSKVPLTEIKSPEKPTEDTVTIVTSVASNVTEKSPGKVSSISKSPNCSETDNNPEKSIETVDNTETIVVLEKSTSIPQSITPTTDRTSSPRKRKMSELQKLRTCSSGNQLIRKINTLKRNIANKCHTVSAHQVIPEESEVFCVPEEQPKLDKESDIVQDSDYIPKKRSRVAHIPKIPVIERNSSVSSSLRRKSVQMNGDDIKEKSAVHDSKADTNDMHVSTEEKPMEKNSINLNEQASTAQEMYVRIEKAETKNDSIEEPNVLDTSVDVENVTENHNDSYTIMSDTDSSDNNSEDKNISIADLDDSFSRDNLTLSPVDDSLDRTVESNDIKTEAKNDSETFEHDTEDFMDVKETEIDRDACNSVSDVKNECPAKPSTTCSVLSNNESEMSEKSRWNVNQENTLKENVEPSHNQSTHLVHVINSSNNSLLKSRNMKKNKKVATGNSIKEEHCTAVESKADNPLAQLKQCLSQNKCANKNCKKQYKKLLHVRLLTDKFIKKQLHRVMDSNWQMATHLDVIEKLKNVCSTRIIAKGIVDFLTLQEKCNKGLDKTFTPPAPLMTKAQQRIAALLIDLEESHPMIFHYVQAGIEYRLFRLNQSIEQFAIASLARMFTILARIKKDRERVRIFCCDALYCLGLHAIIILYTTVTCWPEVFPNHETNKELLPKCMAHIINTQQATDFPKIQALKNLMSLFYKYQLGTFSNKLLSELLVALQEKCDAGVETAIILLAKKEGTTWTYKNIIRGALLPLIINNKVPSTYRAFSLLGNLMRVFPIEDKDNLVGEIIEQLCDLINSGEGSDEQQEGIISALLSLSRHKFDDTVQNVMKWTPNAPLHDRTIEQINGLCNLRTADFWRNYLRKHKFIQ